MNSTRGCKMGPKSSPCSTLLTRNTFERYRSESLELSWDELDSFEHAVVCKINLQPALHTMKDNRQVHDSITHMVCKFVNKLSAPCMPQATRTPYQALWWNRPTYMCTVHVCMVIQTAFPEMLSRWKKPFMFQHSLLTMREHTRAITWSSSKSQGQSDDSSIWYHWSFCLFKV